MSPELRNILIAFIILVSGALIATDLSENQWAKPVQTGEHHAK